MAFSWAPPAAASPTAPQDSVYEPVPDTVLAGVLEDWPPEYATGPDGRPVGFAVEVFDSVAARAGIHVEYRVFPNFTAARRALIDGMVDVVPTMGITALRRESMGFTRPIQTMPLGVLARAGSREPAGLDDLAGRRMAFVRGNVGEEIVPGLRGVEPVPYASVQEALFALLAGHVDLLMYPIPVVQQLTRSAGIRGEVRVVGEPFGEIHRAAAVRQALAPALVPLLDDAIDALLADDAYGEMYARWHAPPPPYWTPRRLAWAAILVAGLLLAGMAVWRHRTILAFNRRLRTQEIRYRFLVESLAEGIIITGRDGAIHYANRRATEILGYSRDELVGLQASTLDGEEGGESTADRLARRVGGARETYETRLRRKDGTTIWTQVHASPYRLEGSILGSLAAISDITARKDAERALRERDDQLHRAQRLEAIGRLAAGVAHDFNNLLTGIAGYAEIVADHLPPQSAAARDVDAILESTQRASGLTRQLLTFGRQRRTEVVSVRVEQVVRGLEPMIRRLIGEDIRFTVSAEDGVPPVRADPVQLEQVVMNLMVNARDAMPRGGRLEVGVGRARSDGHEGWVELVVADSGHGMDSETAAKVFEPFFTTKSPGHGTGLGLATVYGIVSRHGGTVDVDSEPGRGTRFVIRLPADPEPSPDRPVPAVGHAAPEPTVDARRSPRSTGPRSTAPTASDPSRRTSNGSGDPGGSRTASILVVEDEDPVRELVYRVLDGAGYSVTAVATGESALSVIAENGGLDLLITDVVMPGMRGTELARRVREARPDLPVLLISGYPDGAYDEALEPGPEEHYLPKPFTPAQLRARVSDLLADGG